MKVIPFKIVKKFIIFSFIVVTALLLGALYYMEFELPDIEALKTTPVQAPLRIYTQDNKLIGEFGEKRSNPVPFDQIPKPLIDAVLATEDQHYFQHAGIDVSGLLRATIKLIVTGKKEEGGSTITMQVARNFYLTRYKTFGRKFQEILLAIKIDHGLTKQKILELYLNTIFLGNRAYGVGAAAEIYYGKPLAELSLPEYAMLAGLPKAPSLLNPIANPIAAKKRRDHVLSRLRELNYITETDYQTALNTPLNASYHQLKVEAKAPYAAELARQQLEEMYGDSIYTDGFNVYTTIDSQQQEAANIAVRDQTIAYDQRHGYRGPEQNIGTHNLKHARLIKILANIPALNNLEPAIVTKVSEQSVNLVRNDGSVATISWAGLAWARRQVNADYLGQTPHGAQDILKAGDVIRIIQINGQWHLAQLPRAQAGLVALNPQNGAILALVGGFDFQLSSFDRITNAQRQPGSSFKPFIYSAALDKGYTLASIINDGPVVVENPDHSLWRPQNDTHEFYGPTRLRDALVHSRNLVSIRLLQQIEVPYAIDYIKRFGFTNSSLPEALSLALGTASVTAMDMAAGYAVFANGGFKVTPYIVETIRNTQNLLVYEANPLIACTSVECEAKSDNEKAPRAISEQNAFLVTSVLHDVIAYGTATRALALKRNDLSGKTGTTNNQFDAWFVGYNTQLVALTWMGFDQPQSLHEYGAQAALPMWISFMKAALNNVAEQTIPQPPGILSIRIDPLTGVLASADMPEGIFEYFMQPYLPTTDAETKTENAPPVSQIF
ncbi:MAG: penicillin-binding protein 1A [Pseudomonadota bacterium]